MKHIPTKQPSVWAYNDYNEYLDAYDDWKNKMNLYMYWYLVHVYHFETVLGSFYASSSRREDIVKEINEKYGIGAWTRYVLE